jgi:hypothetical protein
MHMMGSSSTFEDGDDHMGSLVKRTQQVEKNKRFLAIGVTAAGVAVTALTPIWVIGVPVMAAGAWLGWDWFKFRAKNGMRF